LIGAARRLKTVDGRVKGTLDWAMRMAWYFLVVCWAFLQVLAAEVVVHDVGGDRTAQAWGKDPVRVAFWNVQWFPGKQPKPSGAAAVQKQIQAAAGEVRKAGPDILFAQEIRDRAALQKLAPGRAFYYCTAIPRPEDESPGLPNQGLALASRWVPRRVWVLDFSRLAQTPGRPVRGILAAEFALASGPLVVYGVHLKSNRGDPAGNRQRRQRAIDLLKEDWRRQGLDPRKDRILIGGDFNTSPHDPQFEGEQTLGKLTSVGFVPAGAGRVFTVAGNGKFPPNDFDHVFVSPGLVAGLAAPHPWLRVRPFVPAASDHALLVMEVRVRGE
jgi:endonuclease/exonuclease/phosphatase family metal-dependent hydrolase